MNLIKKVKNEINDEDMKKIAEMTEGYSGSDLKELVKDAAYGPIRELSMMKIDIGSVDLDEVRGIMLKDFEESMKSIRKSVSQDQLKDYEKWNEEFGSKWLIELY